METLVILYGVNIERIIPITLDILYNEGKIDSDFILNFNKLNMSIFEFEEWINKLKYTILINNGNILLCKLN